MLRSLRLTAILVAALAAPALAQTPSARTPSRPAASPVPAASTPAASTPATPAARPATPSAATPAVPSTTASASGGKIDINTASEQQLDALPGIGPVLAQHVIAGRPWDDLADLVKKKALPQGVYDRNKDRFALANINTSSAADLAKTLPGIGEVRSRAIVTGRPYASPNDLVGKKVLTQNQYDKIKDLIAF